MNVIAWLKQQVVKLVLILVCLALAWWTYPSALLASITIGGIGGAFGGGLFFLAEFGIEKLRSRIWGPPPIPLYVCSIRTDAQEVQDFPFVTDCVSGLLPPSSPSDRKGDAT